MTTPTEENTAPEDKGFTGLQTNIGEASVWHYFSVSNTEKDIQESNENHAGQRHVSETAFSYMSPPLSAGEKLQKDWTELKWIHAHVCFPFFFSTRHLCGLHLADFLCLICNSLQHGHVNVTYTHVGTFTFSMSVYWKCLCFWTGPSKAQIFALQTVQHILRNSIWSIHTYIKQLHCFHDKK